MAGILTIAKWEILRSRLDLSKRTLLVIAIFLLVIAAGTYSLLHAGVRTDSGIYTVAVSESDSDIAEVIRNDDRFTVLLRDSNTVRDLYQRGDVDIAIINRNVYTRDTKKSNAALGALTDILKAYREATLSAFSTADLPNSFPVWVTIHYLHRPESFQMLIHPQTQEEGKGMIPIPEEPMPMPPTPSYPAASPAEITSDDAIIKPKPGFLERQTVVTPSNLRSPIPFTSAILAFLFMFPMFFIAQFFSASVMNERTNRNGEFLLVSPLRTHEILIGKMLPYLTITLFISFFLAVYMRSILSEVGLIETLKNSITIVAIMLPVVLIFLAFYFIASIIARSFKELTFVTVFFSTAVSSYLFFPVMFAHIHAISIISPMTLVVKILEGEVIELNEYIFSAIPFYCVSLAIFAFGTLIFREEDLFTQINVKEKVMDAIELFLNANSHPQFFLLLLSLIFVPFVYITELMLVVLLFAVPLPYSIIAMIVMAGVIEELFKSVGLYTLFSRGHTDLKVKNAILLAILAASGFFIGEKLIALLTIAPIASSVFGAVMSSTGAGVLLIFPLLLHIACTTTVSFGLLLRKNFVLSLLPAVLIHSAYNLYFLGGVLFQYA